MSTEQTHHRVLVVEDEAGFASALQIALEYEGYVVQVEIDGSCALPVLESWQPDVVLLDLMLPGIPGLELLRRWRKINQRIRIIILSARTAEVDKVTALQLGADDYITKPFGLAELLTRIKVQLWRARQEIGSRTNAIWLGDTRVDLAAHTVTRGTKHSQLTPRECALLSALVTANGAVVSKEQLLRDVWGHKAIVDTNAVEVQVMTLRRKVEPDRRHPKHIVTVNGVGYRLQVN